jgi:ubiquitin-protein ligase
MVNTAASRRLTKEYINIQKSPPAYLFARPLENNILEWYERLESFRSQSNRLPDMNDIPFLLPPKEIAHNPFFSLLPLVTSSALRLSCHANRHYILKGPPETPYHGGEYHGMFIVSMSR